jgi:iron(III) transport system ATP-binding protein
MIPVTIKNLTKRFGGVVALDGVNLEIASGEIFFLLGPSGCGKTTLLRTVAGFYAPDAGEVFFGDENVTRVPPHRRNTGMMFQSYALWPHMTVAENVAFGLKERKLATQEISSRVDGALAAIRMGEYAARKIHELSGGQQQRVALARALVVRPRCLLLVEPLSNLDAKLRLEMRSEIRRVCKESGLTAIYVTHDQKEALSIADRIAILENGRVRQVDTPDGVYRRPGSKFVADFIGETNFVDGTLTALNDGQARVATALGDFNGTVCDRQLKAGDAVTLSIRPESWKLQAGGRSENCMKGRIYETTYLGEMAQYRLACNGVELKIFELNPRPIERAENREIHATVDAEDVIVLARE